MKEAKPNRKRNTKPENPSETTMTHGLWSGTVSFSLVAIPVRVVKAVEPGRISFRTLHNRDYSPLHRRMVCPAEGRIVPPEEIIRGYEIASDRYITITDEELESVSPERSRTIEIAEFVDLNEVDPIYFDHPYFLVPLKGGEKSYSLLAEAMHRTNKAGIARFVMDEREYLVTVRSRDGALALSTLHYQDEIAEENHASKGEEAGEKEKNAIKNSIAKRMSGFAPEQYSDSRRKKLMEILEKKAKGRAKVEAPETEEEPGEAVADLMAALEESMRKSKKSR